MTINHLSKHNPSIRYEYEFTFSWKCYSRKKKIFLLWCPIDYEGQEKLWLGKIMRLTLRARWRNIREQKWREPWRGNEKKKTYLVWKSQTETGIRIFTRITIYLANVWGLEQGSKRKKKCDVSYARRKDINRKRKFHV